MVVRSRPLRTSVVHSPAVYHPRWRHLASVVLSLSIMIIVEELPVHSADVRPSQSMIPQRGYVYHFPRDHGSHDHFLLEWWYVTGHLFTEDGRRFGYELTFFRRKLEDPRIAENPSRWALRHLYFAHFALTDVEHRSFQFAEKLSRAGIGKAGAPPGRLDVWIDRWHLRATTSDHRKLHLEAQTRTFGLALDLLAQKNPVIHGEKGVSRKGEREEEASHYYSLTRLRTMGEVHVGSARWRVTGVSWMDHEFGSGQMAHNVVGWDWFSLQLDSNMEVMVYLLRQTDGTPHPASSGTVVFPDGQYQHLPLSQIRLTVHEFWKSPHSGAKYPASWTLDIRSLGLSAKILPLLPDQELQTPSTQVTYWEGAVDVSGIYRGQAVTGTGYVELTGYAHPLQLK
ncbi:MAG: carotenoid 1,2-hydratase [Nitrospirae bacterium]|nr:MAG: carotenoid 1,2-hydratase [Nitrospirota bacterium]